MKIQKYQNSTRFGRYVQDDLGVQYSIKQLEQMSEEELESILCRIRVNLSGRNMEKIYERLLQTMTFTMETAVSPYYECKGLTQNLMTNQEFLELFEQWKIEQDLPEIPLTLQIAYMMIGTIVMTHEINKIKNPINNEQQEQQEVPINKI